MDDGPARRLGDGCTGSIARRAAQSPRQRRRSATGVACAASAGTRISGGRGVKRTGLERKTPLRPSRMREARTPLPRQSQKRAVQAVARRKLVAAYLEAHPVCARCYSAASTDVHEKQKRSRNPQAWLDPSLFCALCRRCHEWTEAEPAQATLDGFLLPSWWKPADTSPEDGRSWERSA